MKNEKRLIDANALLIPKYGRSTDEFVNGYRQGKIDALIEVAVLAPTVDAVEVVRCKDCTEWDEAEQECKHWYGFRADNFCSYGERKDDV